MTPAMPVRPRHPQPIDFSEVIEIDTYEFHGHVFHVGDRVRVMNEEEAIAQYGMNDRGYPLFPSGAFNYKELDNAIGGMEFTITHINSTGRFYFSTEEPFFHKLNDWVLDAEICVEADFAGFVEPEDDLDIDTLSTLLGGD